jgi:hypothetical protein
MYTALDISTGSPNEFKMPLTPTVNYTPEQLTMVEELAGLFYTPKQIAIMTDISIVDFKLEMAIPDSPILKPIGKDTTKPM